VDWDRFSRYRWRFVLFSGGKDSLATLALCQEKLGDVVALHADTTASLPENLDYIRDICLNHLVVPLVIVRPTTDYFTLAKRWGVPSVKARWCCYHLKIEPMKKFLKDFHDKIIFDGIRREESRKRSQYGAYFYHKAFKAWVVHPIIDWTTKEVLRFLKDRGLPLNPIYAMGFRSPGCWCGVYKSRKEFERLRVVRPELFARLVEIENSLKTDFAYSKVARLKELERQKLLDHFLA